MSIISAGTTSTTAFRVTSDTTGSLVLKTGASGATAIDIDAAQVVTIGNIAVTGGTINNTIIGGTTAAAGTFTTLTAASTVTFNGGTANGVAYLNGSKNLTTGSALTFDGTIFRSTQLNIGTAPNANSRPWALNGFGYISGASGNGIEMFNSSTSAYGYWTFESDNRFSFNAFGGHSWTIGGSEGMRLTSTGLGIGTSSPSYKLHVSVADTGNTFPTNASINISNSNSASFSRTMGVNFSVGGGVTAEIISGVYGVYTNYNTSVGGALAFVTNNGSGSLAEKMRLDSSGNLGLGVTPSAWGNGVSLQGIAWAISTTTGFDASAFSTNTRQTAYGTIAQNVVYRGTAAATAYEQLAGQHRFFTAPSGTAGNPITFTQAMTLTSGGNLLVGTATDPGYGAGYTAFVLNNSSVPIIDLQVGGTRTLSLLATSTTPTIKTVTNVPLVFGTNDTERGRFTAEGYFKASNNGSYANSTAAYHELRTSAADYSAITSNNNASPYGAYFWFSAADPNNATNLFLLCNGWNGSANVTRATIRSNGGLANYQSNNVDLSDARTKKDITPAASMWGKIGALEIVTYKYNDQTHDDVNVGVIAQQVESVEPVWVDSDGWGGETPEDGVPLKTVYTKDITFAAIKALQEAMARIESLEADVAALKGAK